MIDVAACFTTETIWSLLLCLHSSSLLHLAKCLGSLQPKLLMAGAPGSWLMWPNPGCYRHSGNKAMNGRWLFLLIALPHLLVALPFSYTNMFKIIKTKEKKIL